MKDVYLSIGTNMGERYENLQYAVTLLKEKEGIKLICVSSVYETAAVGYTEQADFLNIAVHLKTDVSSADMLKICQSIEQELGRVREFRWGPRIIDLDILLYNQENIETECLTVPHPRMYERAFVLVPLVEIAASPFDVQLQQAHDLLQQMDCENEGITLWSPFEEFSTVH